MSETPIRVPWTQQQKFFLWVIIFLVIAIAGFLIGSATAAAQPTPQTGKPDVAAVHAYEVKQLEAAIKKTADQGVSKALLVGPILGVTCIPDGTGNSHSTSYTCLAANVKNADGTKSGYFFTGVINWDSGQYVWRITQ